MKRDDKTEVMFKTRVPAMPEGYYSGDEPNPNLHAFVEEHLRKHPYNPEMDDYSVPAFNKSIEATKATAIYNMHRYWSKKPHDAICQYIHHYTKKGDLVLDPFCGSGGTALAALMEGRKAIAIDRSPAATFITKNYCTPVDVEELKAAFEELKLKVQPEIDWLYETRCDRCDGKATTGYTVYSQVFRCGRCMENVTLFDCVELEGETAKGKPKKIKACPLCYKRGLVEEISARDEKLGAIPVLVSYLCENGCKPDRGIRQHNDKDEKKREYFKRYDLKKIEEVESRAIPYWVPTLKMMNASNETGRWGLLWRPYLVGRTKAIDFFRYRNVWALGCILEGIDSILVPQILKDALRFAFSSNLLNASDMYQFRESGKGGIAAGTYYVGPSFQVMNVWRGIEDKVNDLKRAYADLRVLSTDISISCQTATELKIIRDNSIDYIFTDPPYSWKVQYGEANFIWEAWLNLNTNWQEEEIIVNDFRGRTEENWCEMMRYAMRECYRVLKPGRWLSLCYHDTSEGTWSLVQDLMLDVGFLIDSSESALFIDTGQKAWKQIVADKVNKRDLVINFRKPKSGEAAPQISFTGEEDVATFSEKVRTIISDYLTIHPGSTKDRIYDEVVSRMVRAGRMEPHNFDELLAQVADSVSETTRKNLFETADPDLFGAHQVTRWYLKEQGGSAEVSERLTEESAASRIEEFLVRESEKQFQKSQPRFDELNRRQGDINQALAALQSDDPERKQSKLKRELRETERQLYKFEADRAEWRQQALHYTYIQEFYFTINPRPQKTLFDLLEDYFCLTNEGNWRPPLTEEERERKGKERNQSIRHTIQRFCRLLSANEAIPVDVRPSSTTLAEWIKYCKNAQLYAQGKLLYEQGGLNLDDLSEDVLINVEEDYQVCARLLARSMGTEKKRNVRKGRGKKSEFQE